METIRDLGIIDALLATDPEADQRFVIDDDKKAEWALCAIREHTVEADRMLKACDDQIQFYKKRKEEISAAADRKTGYLTSLLQLYFDTVPHKATKTQETYALPSGKLVRRLATKKMEHDDAALMQKYPDFVQNKPSLAWGELKKKMKIEGNVVIDTETGEIVEAITVTETPEKFSAEV